MGDDDADAPGPRAEAPDGVAESSREGRAGAGAAARSSTANADDAASPMLVDGAASTARASLELRGNGWSLLLLVLDALLVFAVARIDAPLHLERPAWSRRVPSTPATFVAETDESLVLLYPPRVRGGEGLLVRVPLTERAGRAAARVDTIAPGGVVLDRSGRDTAVSGAPWAFDGRTLLLVLRSGAPGFDTLRTLRVAPDDRSQPPRLGPAFEGARPEVGVGADGRFSVVFITAAQQGAGREQRVGVVDDDGSVVDVRTLSSAESPPSPRGFRDGRVIAVAGARSPSVALPDGTVIDPPPASGARVRARLRLRSDGAASVHFDRLRLRGGSALTGRYELRLESDRGQVDMLLGHHVATPTLVYSRPGDAQRRALRLDLEPAGLDLFALERGPWLHLLDGRGVHLRLRTDGLRPEGARVSRLGVLAGRLGTTQTLVLFGAMAFAHVAALWSSSAARAGASRAQAARVAGLLSAFFGAAVLVVVWSIGDLL